METNRHRGVRQVTVPQCQEDTGLPLPRYSKRRSDEDMDTSPEEAEFNQKTCLSPGDQATTTRQLCPPPCWWDAASKQVKTFRFGYILVLYIRIAECEFLILSRAQDPFLAANLSLLTFCGRYKQIFPELSFSHATKDGLL